MSARLVARFALCAPPALLTAAGLLLLIATPEAWDAAAHVDQPAWTPAVCGLIFTAGTLGVGAWSLRDALRRTRADFTSIRFQVIFTGAFIVIFALGATVIAARLPEPATYDRLLDDDTGDAMSTVAFLIYTSIGAAFFTALAGALAYAYNHAIDPRPTGRFTRVEGEVDGVGEILRRRDGP
ncbi:MAG TPA: hypothetical protein VI759_07465 [Dehalococcoidia bacterium]|nr:hypothetical protein [Dehalococcoidia bacterium]